jgi:5'-nucleotidase/2',3'-cyclic-nucleotide 2'-phosphodiesterase/3'-nucleotidase/5'-nucleotidase
VLVVRAWEYGDAFVDIDLDIDPATHDTAEIVDVDQSKIAPDPEIALEVIMDLDHLNDLFSC